jgi:type III restriction enzyme
MIINLKNYQEKAINELIESAKKLLKSDFNNPVCVFQAPTGSGKTLMTAKFVEELIKEIDEDDLCFIWLSTGKGDLHIQSKSSLESYFIGFPRVSLVEEEFTGGREIIERNEVVVANWQKLWSKDNQSGEWKVILMKDGEKFNFRDVLEKTKSKRKIILIIDESHIGKGTIRTGEVLEHINADLIIEMSATPKFEAEKLLVLREMDSPVKFDNGRCYFVYVKPEDVIDEGMIKKELIINEKIDKITGDELNSQNLILEASYQKRLELKDQFNEERSSINPLVLIQVPNAETGEEKINDVIKFLKEKNITERKNGHGNGKLAIWLSEQKSDTLNWIAEPDNEIEFLIFKQAIDTGWDCPRAHILVKLRESGSEIFEIQTVGRILRMPEQKHYQNESLNKGYIYTNVQSILVKKEDYNPNIIKYLKSTRKDVYKPIKLVSYYKSRIDYGDITSSFNAIFEKSACDHFKINDKNVFCEENIQRLKECGIILDTENFKQNLIKDKNIESNDFDELSGSISSDNVIAVDLSGSDRERVFIDKLSENLGSFKNVKRSVPKVKTAVYTWFRKYLGAKNWTDQFYKIQNIFLTNYDRHFSMILNDALDNYLFVKDKEIKDKIESTEQWYDFAILEQAYFNQYTDELVNTESYLYEPCYLAKSRSKPELNFETFLESYNKNILWWWKNGENKKDYFGIKYIYPGSEIHTFYPDYLVYFHNGSLGIFEVKDLDDRDGTTDTKFKAEALKDYIANNKDANLFGGIVIQKDNVWRVNNTNLYDWNKRLKNDWSDWEILDNLFNLS